MTDTAASFDDVTIFSGRGSSYGDIGALVRGLIGSATMGVAAVVTVGASVAAVTVTGVWMVGIALSGNGHLPARTPVGPAGLALTDMAAYPESSFEAKWARTAAVLPAAARAAAARQAARTTPIAAAPRAGRKIAITRVPGKRVAETHIADYAADMAWEFGAPKAGVLPAPEVAHEVARPSIEARKHIPARAGRQVATLTPPGVPVSAPLSIVPKAPTPPKRAATAQLVPTPLPLPRPAGMTVARAPAAQPKPQATHEVAALTPAVPKPATRKAPALPGADNRTALYDISGHTVYLPDGTRLEAHSGLGRRLDNPRYVKVRMLGPTPPNVYDLTLRKQLFHGVRAIRLNPVNENKMYGRAGMLAHTYMLGPNGQSNGCVSFKHYNRFLQAFLKGKIDRLVVVGSLDEAPAHLASLVGAHRDRSEFRYVAANMPNPVNY